MSFSITLAVDDDGGIEVTSASTGAAAPPPGTYSIMGHVPTEGALTPSVGVATPVGGVSGYMTANEL